jgi:hypothetical protein
MRHTGKIASEKTVLCRNAIRATRQLFPDGHFHRRGWSKNGLKKVGFSRFAPATSLIVELADERSKKAVS